MEGENVGKPLSKLARRLRRMAVSYFAAGLLWVAGVIAYMVAYNPQRALYNLRADPAQVLFITALSFVILATPVWLVALAVLALIDRLRRK
jgi:Na+/proline symporter